MDIIADILVRLKTASAVGKEQAVFKHSAFACAVLAALERAGYVDVVPKKGKKPLRHIEVKLKRGEGGFRFTGGKQMSRQSKRFYTSVKNLVPVKSGFGHAVLSTPKGILIDKEARTEKVGGEVLFYIW